MEKNWAYSFIVPGVIMAAVGILILAFLVVHPEDVGCQTTLETMPQVCGWELVFRAVDVACLFVHVLSRGLM